MLSTPVKGIKPLFARARTAIGQFEYVQAVEALRRLKLVSGRKIAALLALAMTSVITEAFGLFMILPILQIVETGGQIGTAGPRFLSGLTGVLGRLDIKLSIPVVCGIAFGLILVRQVVSYVNLMEQAELRENMARTMRREAVIAVMSSQAAHIQKLGSGTFLQLLHSLAPSAGAVLQSLISTITILMALAVYSSGLLILSPGATIFAIVFGSFLAYFLRSYQEQARALSRQLVREFETFLQHLSERYAAWRLVKLSNQLDYDARLLDESAQKIAELNIRIARSGELMQLWVTPAAAIVALLGLYLAVTHFGMTVSDVTIFVIVFVRLLPTIQSVLSSRQRLAASMANLARAESLIAAARSQAERMSGTQLFAGIHTEIIFDRVSFRYEADQRSTLDEVSLQIPAYKMTALLGPSGAGKSTLVDLFPRLIEPASGRITVDGVDLHQFELTSLRTGMAIVSQHPQLFSGSIAANLLYGRPDATREELRDACRKAFALSFIDDLPAGFDTRIGEAGATLSGGQRQRLALARAFLSRSTFLILDEPTSALDYESERLVQKAIETILQELRTTVIVIAHRASTVRAADNVIVMDRGKVIEQGPPHALMHADTWFSRMAAGDIT